MPTKKKTKSAATKRKKPPLKKRTGVRTTRGKNRTKAPANRRHHPKNRPAKTAAPNPWRSYADQLEREMQTTLKVMRAFPADQDSFRPHPRSSSAMSLFHTFGVEQNAALMAINGDFSLNAAFALPTPSSLSEAITNFERIALEVVLAARRATASDWHNPLQFPSGPQQMGEITSGDFATLMLVDQIHHRGQLSVYVRMAGGKVPSIYGPSADEPW